MEKKINKFSSIEGKKVVDGIILVYVNRYTLSQEEYFKFSATEIKKAEMWGIDCENSSTFYRIEASTRGPKSEKTLQGGGGGEMPVDNNGINEYLPNYLGDKHLKFLSSSDYIIIATKTGESLRLKLEVRFL